MAATQKLQHILGTTAMRCSQGGLGKGGVPSLETPPTSLQEINGNPLSWAKKKSGQTVVGYIYHWNWKNGGACPKCESFLAFSTIAFYLGFRKDGS